MALNHARLPVPPLALVYALNLRKAALSGCSESFAAAEVAPDAANHVSGYRKQLSRNLFRIKFSISGPRGLFGSAQPWTPTIHVLFRRHEARPTRTPELRRHMAVGRLLRELHDATANFQPPADAVWQPWLFHSDGPGSVVSEG